MGLTSSRLHARGRGERKNRPLGQDRNRMRKRGGGNGETWFNAIVRFIESDLIRENSKKNGVEKLYSVVMVIHLGISALPMMLLCMMIKNKKGA